MRIGVHCSIRNGLVNALKEAEKLGCNTVQIFTRSPRMWHFRNITKDETETFKKEKERLKISPLVVHIPYLPNLATSDNALYAKSLEILIEDYTVAAQIGADYFIVHPGAYSLGSSAEYGIRRVNGIIKKLLGKTSGGPGILVENVSGGGRRLGSKFEEIKDMLDGIKKAGICLDTCHTFAAGYRISGKSAVNKTLKEFDRVLGIERLKVIHFNDSYFPFGSRRDRHQHLGKGYIGKEGLTAVIRDRRLKDCAFILETPRNNWGDYTCDLRNLKFARGISPESKY